MHVRMGSSHLVAPHLSNCHSRFACLCHVQKLEGHWHHLLHAYARAGRVNDLDKALSSMRSLGLTTADLKVYGMRMHAHRQAGDFAR